MERGGSGRDKDEGEDSEILRWQNQQGLGTNWGEYEGEGAVEADSLRSCVVGSASTWDRKKWKQSLF